MGTVEGRSMFRESRGRLVGSRWESVSREPPVNNVLIMTPNYHRHPLSM